METLKMLWQGDVSKTGTFRPMCHAASVGELPNGELMAVWYEGSYETAKDSVIMATTTCGFADACFNMNPTMAWSWVKPDVLVRIPGSAVGNPTIHITSDGVVQVFFVILKGELWTSSQIALYCFKSVATAQQGLGVRGAEFADMDFIPGCTVGWMTKNKLLELSEGIWLLPIYDEVHTCPLVLRSQDQGASWRVFGDTTAIGVAEQPALVELTDGRILMLTRTKRGRIWRSYSYNRGLTWTASQPTALPNPDSGIDLVRTKAGRIVTVLNDLELGRDRLVMMVSEDEAGSWGMSQVVDQSGGEISYPVIFTAGNGLLHILYTWQRIKIRHCILRELS